MWCIITVSVNEETVRCDGGQWVGVGRVEERVIEEQIRREGGVECIAEFLNMVDRKHTNDSVGLRVGGVVGRGWLGREFIGWDGDDSVFIKIGLVVISTGVEIDWVYDFEWFWEEDWEVGGSVLKKKDNIVGFRFEKRYIELESLKIIVMVARARELGIKCGGSGMEQDVEGFIVLKKYQHVQRKS
ncbi:hypothetical protein Tco_0439269 [Tanacetum coccineum]